MYSSDLKKESNTELKDLVSKNECQLNLSGKILANSHLILENYVKTNAKSTVQPTLSYLKYD